MPAAIPLAIGAASLGATAAGAAGIIGATTATLVSVGLGVAGTLAQTLLAETPDKPKMQDGDVSIKQAIPPRTRMYGRQRLGGVFLYYDSTSDGDLNTLVCHAAHECDALEEHWLNDERVQLDGDGNVTDDPWWQEANDDSTVVIVSYLGSPSQTIANLPNPPWTAAHRGRGLCATRVKYSDLKDEDQLKVFPSGPPPYRAVLRGAKIYDPRTAQDPEDEATWAWSDNAALVVLDYMTRTEQGVPVGFGIPFGRIDMDSFEAAAAICDQTVALKAGGTEKRWRAWGAYELTEDRKAVLQDLLDACGGRVIQGPDGKYGLTVGAPGPVAAVTLTEDHILEWDLNQGKPAIERINEVRATYVSQAWEWAETEAGIQLDQAAIDRNGVESSQIKLRFVPSESQAQRVAKEVLKRGNPSHAGRIRTTLAGLDAWGERWIRLQIAELGIDAVFEITSMSLNQADMTVSMEVASYDNWWEWTAATDEKDPAIPPPDSDDDAEVPVPQGVDVNIIHRLVNGQTYVAIGLITWDPPPRSVYVAKARYRPLTPPSSPWQPLPVAQDNDQVETFPLEDGTAYEAQVRFIGPRGAGSDWSASATFTAVADPVAPASPTGLTAQANTPATGQVTVTATQPNDPRAATLRFYRNSSNTFVGATLLSGMPLYAGPGQARSVVESPGAGDWWYFATSSNWSNVASAPAGGVLAEVSPAAPVITSPSGPTSSYDRRPVVSGNGATAGATIKLYSNAVQVGTATAAGDGAWSVTPSSDLGLGANSMTATQTVGGNESVASGSVTITVNAIDSDAWALIAAMTNRPPYARQTLIKNLVDSAKSNGWWMKMLVFGLIGHDSQASGLNWKAPATFVFTPTSSPTFTADAEWKGTGSGSTAGGYLAGSFNPVTQSVAQNDFGMSLWVRTAGTATGGVDMGNVNARIRTCDDTAGNMSTRCNDASSVEIAAGTPTGTGFYSINRSASGGYDRRHETTDLTDATTVSTGASNQSIALLRGDSATHSNSGLCAWAIHTALTGTEQADMRTDWHTYLAAIGAVA